MKCIVIDKESSGLFRYDRRADDPSQPRIAQIACALVDSDTFEVIGGMSTLVRPVGWEMPADLAEKLGHGLTHERLLAEGIPIADAIAQFMPFYDQAELIAGFNPDYDLKLLRGELRRLSLPDRYGEKPVFDAMRASAKLCGLKNVKGGPKNPKLHEALEILCGETLDGAHDARGDVWATIKIIKELKRRGVEIVGKEQPKKLQTPDPVTLVDAAGDAVPPPSQSATAAFVEPDSII